MSAESLNTRVLASQTPRVTVTDTINGNDAWQGLQSKPLPDSGVPSVEDAPPPHQDMEIRASGKPQLDLKLSVTAVDTRQRFGATALVDSGCTASCVDRGFVQAKGLNTKPLAFPHQAWNADGTLNGTIKDYVTLEIEIVDSAGDPHRELIDLPVVNLGKHEIFLGFDWLERHNPSIDWFRGEARAALSKARDLMKRYYDRRHGKAMDYKAGDLIWLEKTNIGST